MKATILTAIICLIYGCQHQSKNQVIKESVVEECPNIENSDSTEDRLRSELYNQPIPEPLHTMRIKWIVPNLPMPGPFPQKDRKNK